MRRYYAPTNARLAIVAPRPALELKECVETAFATFEPMSPQLELHYSIPSVSPRRTFVQFDGIWYVWIRLALLSSRSDATMRFAAKLAANHLGYGPHSALFRRLRSDSSLAYAVSADDWPDLDRTVVHCFASVQRRSMFAALDIILEEIRRLVAEGIS